MRPWGRPLVRHNIVGLLVALDLFPRAWRPQLTTLPSPARLADFFAHAGATLNEGGPSSYEKVELKRAI